MHFKTTQRDEFFFLLPASKDISFLIGQLRMQNSLVDECKFKL